MAEKFKALVTARFGSRVAGTKLALRFFRRADRNRDKDLDKDEFRRTIRGVRDEDIDDIYEEMDVNKNGTLELREIIRVLRADMPETRVAIIRRLFKAADKDRDGIITITDLRAILNVTPRQDELDQEKTEDEIFNEFLQSFEPDPQTRNGEVTVDELIDYYSRQSPYYFTDESFRLFIQSQWHCDDVRDAIAAE